MSGRPISEQELKRPPFAPVRHRRASNSSKDFVAAALRVCEQEGPGSITARKIAKAMNLSPMALYRHFKSMDHLLVMVWNEGFTKLNEMVNRPLVEGNYSLASFRKSIECYVEFGLQNPGLYQFMFSSGPRPEEFNMKNVGMSSYQFLNTQFVRFSENGVLPRDLDIKSASMHTAFVLHGLTSLIISGQVKKITDQDLESVISDSVDKLIYSLERKATN